MIPERTKNFNAWLKAAYKYMPVDQGVAQARQFEAMQKADVPLTYSTSTTWFDPVYLGSIMLSNLTRSRKAFSALTKTTYQQEGDSYQVISTDAHGGLGMILESGALYGTTEVPALVDVDSIYPAIIKYDWTYTEVANALSRIQRSRVTPTMDQVREYATRKFWDAVEMQITGVYNDFAGAGAGINPGYGVDSAASQGGTVAEFECIDRMITNQTESGATTYVNSADDGDVFWNSTGVAGTKRVDRSASAAWDATLRLPTGGSAAAGEAYNITDELDDLMTQCLVYADNDEGNENGYDYIALMSPKAYNKLKAEADPKEIITQQSNARQTINGVTSTPGVTIGKLQGQAIRLSDITVPIVTAPYLMGTADSSWLWKNVKHSTGGPGHVYLINQRAMEFRILIPLSYRSIQAEDYLETKNTLYMAGQLVAKNWKSHGALKYIAT
jgi:hypothetical protein